jgi:hypothetical protein
MDLQEFINFYDKNEIKYTVESQSVDEMEKETVKFIKSLSSTSKVIPRFNMLFKNIERVSALMSDLAIASRGAVKGTILNGAVSLFKQSRERAAGYLETKKESIDKWSQKLFDGIKIDGSVADVIEEVEFDRMDFERFMEKVTETVIPNVSDSKELNFFMTEFLKSNMLETTEEKKYYEYARILIEYFVIQSMLYRITFECIQQVIKGVLSRIKLSSCEDKERKEKAVGEVYAKFFRNYVGTKFGNSIGQYFAAYTDSVYNTSQDRKDTFSKFENIINIVLGVRSK